MKYVSSPLTLLLIFVLSSCKLTDPENQFYVTDEEIYSNIDKVRAVVNGVYSGLPNGYANIGASWLAAACDEAEEVNNQEAIQDFNLGSISPYNNPDDVWSANYGSIRKAQVFLKATEHLNWDELRLSNPEEYARRNTLTQQYRAEVRFLIAFFYFELIKRYGGVPIVDEVINKEDPGWVSKFPRRPFETCIQFIVNYCDTAAKYLPATYDAGNYGRATKGAALALKARTLLYAASDLYNQPGNPDPMQGYTSGDRHQRWIDAALASKAIIEFTPKYAFQPTYEGLFLLGSGKSNEVIFERRYTAGNAFEKQNTAIGFVQGQTGTCPSANLVDAYEHLDDETFDWNNPEHAANPYVRRDPRLEKTIVVNDSRFGKLQDTVALWRGGINGLPRERASKTGYYLRKWMNESLDLQLNETSTRQWIFFRLSEMYLNYAEAMNEAFGPETAGDNNLTLTALSALNLVRTRAAVGLKNITASIGQEQLRAKIRRERRIELAFEGHRYWDVRRWMVAHEAIGGTLNGVNIVLNSDGTFKYTPVAIETRVWSDRLYYYPIPQTEINKSKGTITQNKGW